MPITWKQRKKILRDRLMLQLYHDPRKPKIPESWKRKKRVTVNAKLRDAIIEDLPFDMDKVSADVILHIIFDTIKEALLREEKVTIPGFGRFEVRLGRSAKLPLRYNSPGRFGGWTKVIPLEHPTTPRKRARFHPCIKLRRFHYPEEDIDGTTDTRAS